MDPLRVDELVRRFAEALPSGARELRQELEGTFKGLLTSAISNLNLVTREEFDVQAAVLARTRAKLEMLEQQVAALEQQVLGASGTTQDTATRPLFPESEIPERGPSAPGAAAGDLASPATPTTPAAEATE